MKLNGRDGSSKELTPAVPREPFVNTASPAGRSVSPELMWNILEAFMAQQDKAITSVI